MAAVGWLARYGPCFAWLPTNRHAAQVLRCWLIVTPCFLLDLGARCHAAQVLRALGLLSPDDVAALDALAAEVEQYKASVQEEEEAFEDIPGALQDLPLL